MDVEPGTGEADALALACADARQIRATLTEAGDTSPLDALITAAREGADVRERLWELHRALQRAGDGLGLAPLGIRGEVLPPSSGGLGSVYRVGPPAGVGDPRPVEVVFLCPSGSCTRVWRPEPNSPSPGRPHCQLLDRPLRWERL